MKEYIKFGFGFSFGTALCGASLIFVSKLISNLTKKSEKE